MSASTSDDVPDLSEVPAEYHDFADVFGKSNAYTLAQHRPYDLKIEIPEGTALPVTPMYPLSQLELQALRDFIEEHLRSGFIRSTSSPHGAPILFAKKKDSGLRLCIDFRGLNKITKMDRYPLPFISDLLTTAGKARVYTTLDIRHAYHMIRIAEGDEWKTAFRTRYGTFEWLVMPFGLTNAPAACYNSLHSLFHYSTRLYGHLFLSHLPLLFTHTCLL